MLTIPESLPRLQNTPLSVAALVRVALDPAVAITTLLLSAYVFGDPLKAHYLILILLVFSCTFPGSAPRSSSVHGMATEIAGDWIAIVAILSLLGWVTQTFSLFDQNVLLLWIISTPFALFAAHLLTPVLVPRVLAVEGLHRVAVIAGAGELGRKAAERISNNPFLGVRVAGYFDDRSPQRLGDASTPNMLGSLNQLATYAKRNQVDLIYIALPMASQPRILRLLDELRDTTASLYFIPDIFLFDLIQARVDSIGDMPVVAVCETPFFGINGFIKRISDIVLAALILVLVSPLLLAIAIGVKLTSPGPVLFKQRRYGLDGKEIIVYKFRSMKVQEDGAVVRQATAADPRVTRFGAFLRRTSLDELPQFFNVLQGRMSVVGPRPHAVAHNEMYRKLIKSYMIRHKVKPGITGWAQVNGLRGETETLDKMQARIEHDLDYLRYWSLQFDLQIVWKTMFVVFKKQNAY